MATTIVVSCPECKKQIKASTDLQGKRVKCKACGSIFVVKAAATKANPAPPAKTSPGQRSQPQAAKPSPPPQEEDDRNPYKLTTTELVPRCPFCAHEMESEEARICLNCGYNVQTRSRHETKRTVETKSGDYFQWWLPAIACILFIFAIIGWNVLYIFVIGPAWKDDNTLDFLNSGSIKTWQAIASLFVCFFAGRFAVRRLIINPTPPEKEVEK